MTNDFLLAIYESDTLSDTEKEKLLSLYQEVADPFSVITTFMVGFGIIWSVTLAATVTELVKLQLAIKKYPKLHPEIPEFKTLDEKVFPMKMYDYIPDDKETVKFQKLCKLLHLNSYRVWYHKGTPMFTFAYQTRGNTTHTVFHPVNEIARQHADYYRICTLHDSFMYDVNAMEFAKKVLSQ